MKLEIQKQGIQDKELQRLQIEKKLDQLRETVAVDVQRTNYHPIYSDWNRILRPTKSLILSKQTERLPPLFVNHGFSVSALMKDRRFRVAAALHEAGLNNLSYAHQIMIQLNNVATADFPARFCAPFAFNAGQSADSFKYLPHSEIMAASEEVKQILDGETKIDLEKLRDVGRNGVPDEVRADTWKYLLAVESPDKANEITKRLAKTEKYVSTERQVSDVTKRIRGEVSRYYRARSKSFGSFDQATGIENVVSAYLVHFPNQEYSPVLMSDEVDIFYSFSALMNLIDNHYQQVSMFDRVSEFLMLFRTLQPELHNHFEEEEVDFKECASSWFQYLLAKELPLDYLHVYVCLAILTELKEHLEDLEQSEIRGVLLKLPNMDMDNILNQATTLRDQVMMKRMSDTY
ncbi:hypothetical protein HK100_004896 [Physocladia obscura]|uniref:Rab-GAP TBC domain-containing protein n=1 Tax=Physocladia obscura TaxID=109957 RepID=A0AAD5T6U2_9FUNG|nr:hypothetical protein HK100_004896 [Physocladia obscura]